MGRIIVVHSRDAIINLTPKGIEDSAAHCFGPFDSYAEAVAWDMLARDDCYKMALDLVGPDPDDVEIEPAHGVHHEAWHGSGPSARMDA